MAQNINIETTVQAWANIVIKNWKRKIVDLDIGSTGALFDSLQNDVISNSNGNPKLVEFSYAYYGIFPDMGVGNGVLQGNVSEIPTTRKAKPWKSKVLYSQSIKLSELLSEKYGIIAASVIKENIIQNEKTASSRRPSGGDVSNKRMLASQTSQSSGLTELDKVWMRTNGLL